MWCNLCARGFACRRDELSNALTRSGNRQGEEVVLEDFHRGVPQRALPTGGFFAARPALLLATAAIMSLPLMV